MIKVAFFTNDLKNIDAHFGSCEQFMVYEVGVEGSRLVGVIPTGEERTEGRVEMLKEADVSMLYCIEIGPAAAAKVVNHKIFPMKYKHVVGIEEELEKLSTMLSTNPPPFLQKILEKGGA
ncbi:MAG: dinitrogenase iron-molybdenum cofactor biosynthesis protein [Epsilonproteobacteria bacterium]|nr:dinitrogenase iron-molybdenum cofactor biosynthesis protein [Campylobacterota bacterium]